MNYALSNGVNQEELTTLLTFHYLTWNDSKWALDFLNKHLREILSRPTMES